MAQTPRLSPHVKRPPKADPPSGDGADSRIGAAAAGLSLVWLVLIGAYAIGFFTGPGAGGGGLSALLFLLAAVGPVAVFAMAALLLRRAETIRAETAALRAALPTQVVAGGGEAAALRDTLAAIDARLARIEARLGGAPRAEPKPDAAAARPAKPKRPARPRGQAPLPFDDAPTPAPARPLTWEDVARALDFPRNDRDEAAFAAIEAALSDPDFRALLQAAEDVLALLAAMGLHMEDFEPEDPPLDAWVAYAEGARGPKAAAVGAMHDEDALDMVRDRAKTDPVFRDAGLVFARRWNALVSSYGRIWVTCAIRRRGSERHRL
jgi:hypothetical protein